MLTRAVAEGCRRAASRKHSDGVRMAMHKPTISTNHDKRQIDSKTKHYFPSLELLPTGIRLS